MLSCWHYSGQVAWEGVRDATTADAVAMYFAGDNVDATTPLKLKWAFASSKTHLLAGTGNCRSACTACRLSTPSAMLVS